MTRRSFAIPAGAALGLGVSGCASVPDGDWDILVWQGSVLPSSAEYAYGGTYLSYRISGSARVRDTVMEAHIELTYSYSADYGGILYEYSGTYDYVYRGSFSRIERGRFRIQLSTEQAASFSLSCTLQQRSQLLCSERNEDQTLYLFQRSGR